MVNTHVHVVIPAMPLSKQDNQQQRSPASSVKAVAAAGGNDHASNNDSAENNPIDPAIHGATYTIVQARHVKLHDNNSTIDDDPIGDLSMASAVPEVQLPGEVVRTILSYLDGPSLVACSGVSTTWRIQTHERQLWKQACLTKWPSLQHQLLPQLPGAPDYDIIRLYGGSWKSCYMQGNKKCQTAECMVHVPQFEAPGNHGPDRIVSDTFAIDEHSFCLWIFPRGNPNEVEYYDRSLSVYLVVTDLEKRPLDWLTCAVFTLSVVHPTDPSKTIRWHSSLHDNKFNHALYNWGVHSLGDLSSFKPNGFVFPDGSLRVSTRVRLMSISVRVHVEAGFMAHEGLGLGPHVCTIDLPFCSTLADLLAALASRFPATDVSQCRLWSFSHSALTGQAKRPRKCLSALTTSTPLFGNLLCDGTDIDAYSCCDLFLDPASLDSFVFVKVLDLHTGVLRYVGRLCLSAFPTAQAIVAYLAVAFPHVAHWMSVREECAPQLASMLSPVDRLLPSDVVIFAECTPTRAGASPTSDTNTDRWMMRVRRCLDQYLDRHYKHAKALIANRLHHITLHDIECIGDLLDLPRFRIHSVFAKCHENARRTLQYIMEGRHLGFICDSCGETDFVGARYNCTVCSDYDLCHPCFERSHQVRHRYANVDGKWRRVPNFDDHNPATHPMHCIYPVFS